MNLFCPINLREPGADRRAQPQGLRSAAAFTLIELMVVLVLIGILSAVILPEMKGSYGDAILRSSARELANVFALASSRAVSQNEVHVVRLEQKTGHYAIEKQVHARNRPTGFAPLKDVSGSSGDLDTRISIQVHRPTDTATDMSEPEPPADKEALDTSTRQQDIAFYPDGTADENEVVLKDAAGFGLRLRISPITARVEILELTKE